MIKYTFFSGERLHDFTIGLTNTSDVEINPSMCASYSGIAPTDRFVDLLCAPVTRGRHLFVKVPSGTYLTLCKVDVWQGWFEEVII